MLCAEDWYILTLHIRKEVIMEIVYEKFSGKETVRVIL